MVKVAEAIPAGTCTNIPVYAYARSLAASSTSTPPAGATPVRFTVPVALFEPITNLCRCAGYVNIVKSIQYAAKLQAGAGKPIGVIVVTRARPHIATRLYDSLPTSEDNTFIIARIELRSAALPHSFSRKIELNKSEQRQLALTKAQRLAQCALLV